jgi:hypothetical protein
MNHRTPPRLVSRTTVFTFAVVACVLSAVFIAVTLNQREYVRASVVEQLEAGQRMLSALEHRRARELSAQVATLAENPTLKAAMDTYRSELKAGDPVSRRELLATIEKELTKVADRTQPDVLAVRSSHCLPAYFEWRGPRLHFRMSSWVASNWPPRSTRCTRRNSRCSQAHR